MEDATPAEMLLRLLDACIESESGAIDLAQQTNSQELQALLLQSAHELRTAAAELRVALNDVASAAETASAPVTARRGAEAPVAEDVAATWERAECDALACFRDAFDSDLPPPLVKTVRRHYEAGIARLERLRALHLLP
jgi:hypothetical protein